MPRSMIHANILLILLILCSMPAAAGERAKPIADGNPSYDVQFLDTMVRHHEGGIEMMDLADEKAKDSGIKNMAKKGSKDQTKENSELQSLREQISKGSPNAVNMKLPGMMPERLMQQHMAKLQSLTGTQFDKEFLKIMIKHHQGAVTMSDQAILNAREPEVKSKAQEIHDKQKAEISDMQRMLKLLP